MVMDSSATSVAEQVPKLAIWPGDAGDGCWEKLKLIVGPLADVSIQHIGYDGS